jgi:osmotically-inducible protein OsmY
VVRALLSEFATVDLRPSQERNVMRSVIRSLACVAALLIAGHVPAVAAQEAAALRAPDKKLDEAIEKKLSADSSLKAYHIKVSVDGGIATLTGTVPTEADRARAGRLAMVKGVTRVDNQILVDPYAGTKGTTGKIMDKAKEGGAKTKEGAEKVGEKTKEGAEKVYDKSKEGVGKAYDKSKEGVTKAGDEISDAYILTRVKSRFVGEDVLKGSDINVDVDGKVVTLKGTVPTAAARARAIELAKNTEGVKTVVDKLTIAPAK